MSPVERLSSFTRFDCVEEIDLSVLERFLLLLFFVVFVVVVVLLFLGVSFGRDFIVFTKHDVVSRFVSIACSCSLSSKITTE